MANGGYHEPLDELSAETLDMHRAITSLMEELEAILRHNRDEDQEHAGTRWLWHYNHKHPNMALGGITPQQKLAIAA